jgi:hypothetical protein
MTITTRTERATGAILTIGTAVELGVDPDGGKWVVVCEKHATLVNVATKAHAMSTSARDFCDTCLEAAEEATLSPFQRGYQEALADITAMFELRGADAALEWARNNRMPAAAGIFRRAMREHA